MKTVGILRSFTLTFLTIVAALLFLMRASPAAAAGTCAQDEFQAAGNKQKLGCTANDVNIASASNPRDLSGNTVTSCVAGQKLNFLVDFNVVTTSTSSRSNVGLYLGTIPVGQTGSSALTGTCDDNIISPLHLAGGNTLCTAESAGCLGDPNYAELDGSASDNCGDTTAASTDTVTVELDGVLCPAVGATAIVLPDCTTWQVPGKTIACFSDPNAGWPFSPSAAPGTTSKCSCGQVSIPITPINPTISVTKTPSPASKVEPGGAFTYTVVVTNTTNAAVGVTVNQICDDKYGNIATASTNPAQPACPAGTLGTASNITCNVPATLAQNGTLTCTFDGTFTGTEPMTSTDTVTVNAVSAGGAPLSKTASATVSIGEAAAKAQVLKTLDGGQECATARYKVEVDNIGPVSTDESVSLTGATPLSDSKFGDITSLGSRGTGLSVVGTTCGVASGSFGLGTMASGKPGALLATGTLSAAIPVSGKYTCEFDGQFCGALGTAGSCGTGLEDMNTITATLTGDDGEAVTGSNTATLTVDSCFTHTP